VLHGKHLCRFCAWCLMKLYVSFYLASHVTVVIFIIIIFCKAFRKLKFAVPSIKRYWKGFNDGFLSQNRTEKKKTLCGCVFFKLYRSRRDNHKTSNLSICTKPFFTGFVYGVFDNISAILWWSVLFVEETGVTRENHRPVVSHWQTLSHNVVSHF